MPRQLCVFLCHASQDKPAVRKMYTYLKQHGAQPWLDREDLLPGQDWEVEIPKALFASDVILVCISKNSVNKEGYVQKEIAFALDKALEKPEGTIFIIPVKLEECDVPSCLKRYQWVDYYCPDGRRRLLMSLNLRAQGLGDEIAPVVVEDSKPKIPRLQTPKPEIYQNKKDKEELEKEIPSTTLKEKIEGKSVQRKPYIKFLDPSSLASSKTPPFAKKPQLLNNPTQRLNFRWYVIAVLVLSLLVIGGLGMKSLFSQQPAITITSTSSEVTRTPSPTTSTSMPFTPTLKLSETPSPVPTLGIGSTMISEKDGMVMVYVPAGEFTMGSSSPDQMSSSPVHAVYLSAFWIDQTEVTNKKYSICVVSGSCKPPIPADSNTRTSYYSNPEFDNYPVIYVDWEMANTYCRWAGRRLPTESEWEKSARGVDGRMYPWGDESPNANILNYGNISRDTTEVAKYFDVISPYGAYDMAGNVWEWVNDWYGAYQDLPSVNPEGNVSGKEKVIRGGAWFDDSRGVSTTYRAYYKPSVLLNFIGFRCALDAGEKK